MSNVLIDEQNMYDIADAIREKTSTDDKLKPAEMAKKIEDINTNEWVRRDAPNLFQYFFHKMTIKGTMSEILKRYPFFEWDFREFNTMPTFINMFSQCTWEVFKDDPNDYVLDLTTMRLPNVNIDARYLCEHMSSVKHIIMPAFSSEGVDLSNAFMYARTITDITFQDTCVVTGLYSAFYECSNLTRINGVLDLSKLSGSLNWTFDGLSSLREIRFKKESIKIPVKFTGLNYTNDSLQSIVDGLADFTGSVSCKLTFPTSIVKKLTTSQKDIIINKNWVLG